MNDFEKEWDLSMAMEVLKNPGVDWDTWNKAVKWLLLHGPSEVREMLLQASGAATGHCFPNVQAQGCTRDGEVCFDVNTLAEAIGVPAEELVSGLKRMEAGGGDRLLFELDEINKIQ